MPRIPWPRRFRRRAPTERAELGRWGEDLAARELKRRNYRILDRNVRVGRGELDIVATDRDATVFVEVKTRRDKAFGGARSALTPTKDVSSPGSPRPTCASIPTAPVTTASTWSPLTLIPRATTRWT